MKTIELSFEASRLLNDFIKYAHIDGEHMARLMNYDHYGFEKRLIALEAAYQAAVQEDE